MNSFSLGGPDSKYNQTGANPAGFLAGLWHGLIVPLTFFASLFVDGIRIYESTNNGWQYDLGFLIGISSSIGGGGSRV